MGAISSSRSDSGMPATRNWRVRITRGGRTRCSLATQWLPEHCLQLIGRTGQQDENATSVFNPLAGCGAAIVWQHLGACNDVGLATIDGHHLAVEAAETFFDA